MVLDRQIFDVIRPGEELLEQPFQRLIEQRRLASYRYPGNWVGIDTFKERQEMEELWEQGDAWWAVWKHPLDEHAYHTHLHAS